MENSSWKGNASGVTLKRIEMLFRIQDTPAIRLMLTRWVSLSIVSKHFFFDPFNMKYWYNFIDYFKRLNRFWFYSVLCIGIVSLKFRFLCHFQNLSFRMELITNIEWVCAVGKKSKIKLIKNLLSRFFSRPNQSDAMTFVWKCIQNPHICSLRTKQ